MSLVLLFYLLFTKYYSACNAYSIYLPLNLYFYGTPFSSFFANLPYILFGLLKGLDYFEKQSKMFLSPISLSFAISKI